MKESNRFYVAPAVDEAQLKGKPKHHRPLKSLSTRRLWIELESVEYEMRNSLFYSRAYRRLLDKRHSDLSEALDERLEYDDYLCSIDPDYVTDKWGHRIKDEIGDFIRDEINPSRKSRGKCYIGGNGYKIRLKPGPKVLVGRKGRKIHTY